MKGIEFQSIRRANKLKTSLFTDKFRIGRQLFSNIENSDYVPIQYIVFLGELLRTDLTKVENFERIYNEIPERYKKSLKKDVGYFNQLEREQLKG